MAFLQGLKFKIRIWHGTFKSWRNSQDLTLWLFSISAIMHSSFNDSPPQYIWFIVCKAENFPERCFKGKLSKWKGFILLVACICILPIFHLGFSTCVYFSKRLRVTFEWQIKVTRLSIYRHANGSAKHNSILSWMLLSWCKHPHNDIVNMLMFSR